MVKKCGGFTLLEIMVVLGILTIIGVIAVPSYLSYLTESRRSEAHTALLALAQAQEQWFTGNNTYTNNLANLQGLIPAIVNNNINQGNYTYDIPVATNSAFTVRASAVAAGAQAGDTTCGTITLTDAGVQAPAACWVN